MSKQKRASHPIYNLLPMEVKGFDALAELALDLRWSWNHAADEVWQEFDPALWDFTHNPWGVLQIVSQDQIERVSADPIFRKRIDDLINDKRQEVDTPAWFQQNHPQAPLTCVAYFSMEYILSEALPICSGGLGNVAGDQLKSASDLGVPAIGVGLLYPNSVRVELYAEGVNGDEPERQKMRRGQPLVKANGYTFNVQVPSTRPVADYTARVIPQHKGIEVPLEANRILWQL